MSSKHNSLIITTKSDQSLEYFLLDTNVVVAYFEDSNELFAEQVKGSSFDVIYVRDPFNTGIFSLDAIATKLSSVKESQPNARYVDHVNDLEGVLIEDKWRQYQLLSDFMSPTKLATGGAFIEGKHIAKKRISARSKDILFSIDAPLGDDWIIQDRLAIQEELRIYSINGKVLEKATQKSSKAIGQKVKVTGIRQLTDKELSFASEIAAKLPQLHFIGLDVAVTSQGLRLIEVNRSPQFKRYNELSGENIVNGLLQTEENQMSDRITLGYCEEVNVPNLDLQGIVAKIDTGAFSGALHCLAIKLSEDGKTLSFRPLNKKNELVKTTDFEEIQVRSANGHEQQRFIIPSIIELRGKKYETTLGLSDRSSMGFEMIIGRRFLREHNMLVDVTIDDNYDKEWERVNL
jgi:hypothetical protein